MRAVVAILAGLGAGACSLDAGTGDTDEAAPEMPLQGAYAVESRITLSSDASQIDLALATMSAFSQSPGGELLSLAQRANDPALATIMTAISPAVRDRLAGWIDLELDRARPGAMPRELADEVSALGTTILGTFTVESTLTFAPSKVVHSFTNLNFTPASLDILIPIGGLKADTITQLTTATLTPEGELWLGDQRFGLAFGDHAWQALGLASNVLFGSDLRSTFAESVGCAAMASAVAQRCLDAECVGHETELEAFCTRGIELLVTELGQTMSRFDLDLFRFVEGTAQVLDDNADGIVDRIVDGTWNAETDIGLGPQAAGGSFTAERMR